MEIPKATVRFTEIVKECGRPEPVTLWVSPAQDPQFQTAVKRNRIMTVIQETAGSPKDFGLVGFHQQQNAAYWVFPKPLDRFKGKRVVGIKYDLLQTSPSKDRVQPSASLAAKPPTPEPTGVSADKAPAAEPTGLSAARPRNPAPAAAKQPMPEPTRVSAAKPAKAPVAKPKPELVRFRVTVRCSAAVDVQREVEAKSAKKAGVVALRTVADESVEFPPNTVARKVVRVRRAGGL